MERSKYLEIGGIVTASVGIAAAANYEEGKSNRNKEKACQMLAAGQNLQGGDYEKAMGVAKIILAPTGKDLSAIAQNCREHIKAEVSEACVAKSIVATVKNGGTFGSERNVAQAFMAVESGQKCETGK
jgi:hypothetical protein